jgi:predicted MFS family arabinose efflux permease
MLIVGLAVATVGYAALPLAEFVAAGGRTAWLLVTIVVASLGFALYIVNANPFLMAVTSPTERNHVYSVQAALWPLAGFVGSLVGGRLPALFAALTGLPLDNPAPYRYPLLLAAALLVPAVLAVASTRTVPPVASAAPRLPGGPRSLGLIVLLSVVGLLQVAGEGAARTFFNVYLDGGLGVPTAQIGTLAGVGQLLGVLAALGTPLLAARWGNARTMFLASLGITLSLLPLALVPHWGAAGLGFMGVISLASIRRPAVMVYSMEIVPPSAQAAMSGATSMAIYVSWAIVGLGGGAVIPALGYRGLFLVSAAITLAGAALFWGLPSLRHASAYRAQT